MRILFLTPQLPYPPHQGTSLRNYNLIARLARQHRVSLLSLLEPEQVMDASNPLAGLCEWVACTPVPTRSAWLRLRQMLTSRLPDMAWRLWSPVFGEHLRRRLAESAYDVVQVEGIELARYLPLVEAARPRPLIVYDDHNAEWLLQKRACLADLRIPRRWPAAGYSLIQWLRLRAFEADACRRADRVVVASEADRRAVQAIAPQVVPHVVPNGVDLAEYTHYQGPLERYDLVFTGKMDYRPNIDAVLWFCRQVLPLIRQHRPETSLAIVGQRPHARLAPLRSLPRVTMTGWVPDIRPYLAGAAVYIAPLRVGGGTRLKLLQAMAMGTPVVTTTLGAEGFPVQHDEHLLLADTPEQFALAVLALLDDPARRTRLARAAQAFVRASYSWEALVPQLEALYQPRSGDSGPLTEKA